MSRANSGTRKAASRVGGKQVAIGLRGRGRWFRPRSLGGTFRASRYLGRRAYGPGLEARLPSRAAAKMFPRCQRRTNTPSPSLHLHRPCPWAPLDSRIDGSVHAAPRHQPDCGVPPRSQFVRYQVNPRSRGWLPVRKRQGTGRVAGSRTARAEYEGMVAGLIDRPEIHRRKARIV